MSKLIERVEKMETIMNEANQQLASFDALLTQMEQSFEDIKNLNQYYGSKQWFSDREKELPEQVNCGVLGEDLPYNTLIDYRENAIRMLELATKIIKKL